MALLQETKPPLVGDRSVEAAPPGPAPGRPGRCLLRQREALGRDLDEVAAALKIKPAYIAALEEGRPDSFPAPVYARGFMRVYAQHLGLDGDEVLRRFKRARRVGAKLDLSFPMPLAERSMPGNGMLLVAAIFTACG